MNKHRTRDGRLAKFVYKVVDWKWQQRGTFGTVKATVPMVVGGRK